MKISCIVKIPISKIGSQELKFKQMFIMLFETTNFDFKSQFSQQQSGPPVEVSFIIKQNTVMVDVKLVLRLSAASPKETWPILLFDMLVLNPNN